MKIKKVFIIIFLLFFLSRTLVPFIAYADDLSPTPSASVTSTTPTPASSSTPTPTTTPNPSMTPTPSQPTPTTTPQPQADTTPTPTNAPSDTPTPSLTHTPTPDGSTQATDSAIVSPEPSATTPPTTSSPTGTNTSPSTTTTGNATAVTQAENDVNTTSINSQVVNQTINIFLPQDGNVDLSDPSKIAANVVSNNTQNGEVFNISVVNNNAYVNTDVVSIANTGNNTSSGNTEFAINTGNATSLVQLVNSINVTLVNSEIHFLTINIYGTLTGNIILPTPTDTSGTTNCSSCGTQTVASSDATVTNTVGSTANTGTNTVTTNTSGQGVIATGNASTQVTIVNLINQLIFGLSFNYLIINTMGTWDGNFLGWGDLPPANGGISIGLTPTLPTNAQTNTSTQINNRATVNTTISSFANTGNNTITTSSGNGMILTGNAQSIVSLINLVNSVLVNTKGFFAFINIFGTLHGDIGDASKFVTPTLAQTDTTNTPSKKEDGGQLTITNENNTGPYIFPGDTVTFFLNVHNPGTGKVYGSHLHLSLMTNGEVVGSADYDLGDLDANKSLRLTTGLVMSKYAPAGTYTAHAEVTGTTGEGATSLAASSDSIFHIFVPSVVQTTPATPHKPTLPGRTVLAAHTPNTEDTNATNWLLILLIGILTTYVTIRIMRERHHLIYAFTHNRTLKERLNALRLFLL